MSVRKILRKIKLATDSLWMLILFIFLSRYGSIKYIKMSPPIANDITLLRQTKPWMFRNSPV